MNSYRKNAIVAGTLFITAMAASLIGGGIIESILTAPDILTKVSVNSSTVYIGVILEFINATAVVGIAVMLFPILKKHNDSLAIGYVGFRIIESVFCIVSAIIPITLIYLSKEYLKSELPDVSYIKTLSEMIISVRTNLAEIVIPVSFSLGAFLFYYLLYSSKLIPHFISIWGFIGAVFILILIFIEASMIINITFVLPLILNEIFLGIWLIFKGLNFQTINLKLQSN